MFLSKKKKKKERKKKKKTETFLDLCPSLLSLILPRHETDKLDPRARRV